MRCVTAKNMNWHLSSQDFEEPTALSGRRGQSEEATALAGRQHGPDRCEQLVLNPGRLVDDDQGRASNATDGFLGASECENARAIAKLQSQGTFGDDRWTVP